jgi:hypothetical protein
MSIENPTLYELETYEGRKICERRELGGGYCGSASFECHVNQLNNPESWVHSSKDRWLREYLKSRILDLGLEVVIGGVVFVPKKD